MRAVVQRVNRASVIVDTIVVASINRGIAALVGFRNDDTESDLEYIARKLVELRIFPDANGKMNCSLQQIGGELLVVPQFTLYGDARKGRRPSYSEAMEPKVASSLFEEFVEMCSRKGIPVRKGVFGAHMYFELVNDGPVTILLESRGLF
ncbi:MAG: D-aminoacyl-tRNA deacylase [Spirochaetes bacterium]|nr:D-aminoacyl-tRNA deacylase [Spirochaetota bacterium]